MLKTGAERAVVILAVAAGGGSLFLLALFLLVGPFGWIDLDLSARAVIAMDALLCGTFCAQHSVMVRGSFRRLAEGFFPPRYYGAFYSIVSGMALTGMVLLWQESPTVIVELRGPGRWLTRAGFLLALAGFLWCVRSLDRFDPLGLESILAHRGGTESPDACLVIRGPYRWVRHPQYLFAFVLMWSYPDLTADRLVLDVLWTGWIVLGSILEERDMARQFGDDYRRYQRTVPMLIPWRPPRKR